MTCYRSVVFMIKFVSDLLQVVSFHVSLSVTFYRSVVFMIKFTNDLLQVGSFHDKVCQ